MLVKETAEKWLAEAKADMHSQMNFAVVLHIKGDFSTVAAQSAPRTRVPPVRSIETKY
jgi:hypothetical protein